MLVDIKDWVEIAGLRDSSCIAKNGLVFSNLSDRGSFLPRCACLHRGGSPRRCVRVGGGIINYACCGLRVRVRGCSVGGCTVSVRRSTVRVCRSIVNDARRGLSVGIRGSTVRVRRSIVNNACRSLRVGIRGGTVCVRRSIINDARGRLSVGIRGSIIHNARRGLGCCGVNNRHGSTCRWRQVATAMMIPSMSRWWILVAGPRPLLRWSFIFTSAFNLRQVGISVG